MVAKNPPAATATSSTNETDAACILAGFCAPQRSGDKNGPSK
jgi:hypothetical protein